MSDPRVERAGDQMIDDVAASWGVQDVVALLGDTAMPPPAHLRSLVLDVERPPGPVVETLDPVELYTRRVRTLRRILDGLRPDEWSAPVEFYDWSVHGLVAHLLVIERYTATRFGVDAPDVDGVDGLDDDHLSLGRATIVDELAREPEVTASAWAVAARRMVDLINGPTYVADRVARLHGWQFSQASALVVRAIELWTHADDIRRATGRELETPPPAELLTMSSFSVQGLPAFVQLRFPGAQVVPARIVLTGPGGGTYDIGGPGDPVALVALDVVDYCRVAAGRLSPTRVGTVREGDPRVVESLLAAAASFPV